MNTTKRILRDIKNYKNSNLNECGIFCEFSEDNIYNVKILIVGNDNTPYEKGYYLFELIFPANYPFSPPKVNYCTQGKGIRFNPNLYTNGKVCVSLLNTWDGPGWTAACTLNSVVLSLQSLLNENAIQNEPGWDSISIKDTRAQQYNDVIRYANLKIAVLNTILETPEKFQCFKPVMTELFIKNQKFFLDYVKSIKTQEKQIIRSQIYSLFIKIEYKLCFDEIFKIIASISKKKPKQKYQRKAPNKNSKMFDIGYEQISENDGKLYVVSETHSMKKRWKLKNNKIEI